MNEPRLARTALDDGADEPRDTLLIGDTEVRSLLDLAECVEIQSRALRYHAAGAPASPARSAFDVPGATMRMATMPGFVTEEGALACKVLTNAPGNQALGIPRNLSTLLLLDPRSGYPLAVMGGTFLTAARTAATAVLAIRTLADASAARDVGLFGTGPIAAMVVETMAATGGGSVVAYSPTEGRRLAFEARFAREERVRVRCVADPREAAARPVIVTATDGRGPAFEAAWLERGGTVVSVASRAVVAEVPAEVFAGGTYAVVDDARAARAEAAEFTAGGAAIHAELGEILAGDRPGRQHAGERWVFKSTGLAVQDAWTARALYLRAVREGVGRSFRLVGGPA